MSELLPKSKAQSLLWYMTIFFFVFYSVDSICTAVVSVMIDATWSELSGTQKWIRVCLIFKAWASSMLALMTNAAKRIQSDQFPGFSSGDTVTITKQ